jgi:hypothetical protein
MTGFQLLLLIVFVQGFTSLKFHFQTWSGYIPENFDDENPNQSRIRRLLSFLMPLPNMIVDINLIYNA